MATTIITTTQKIKESGVYDLSITKTDNVVKSIKADITAQIRDEDEFGGYTLTTALGTILQEGKVFTLTGDIPSDVLLKIIQEFNEIVNELLINEHELD